MPPVSSVHDSSPRMPVPANDGERSLVL
jgi:hypothetical protein